MKLSDQAEKLVEVFEQEHHTSRGSHTFSVSRTVSIFAVLYEKARNAVEFRAEHLVRRAAIERILKRRTTLETDPKVIAENLTVELLWAKYIDSSVLDDTVLDTLAKIISKYLRIKHHLSSSGSPKYHNVSWSTIIGIASAEIDETIISPTKRQALVHFVYHNVRPLIQIQQEEKTINMLTYIAVERAFAQSDNALITHHLLQMIDPSWSDTNEVQVEEKISQFIVNVQAIQESLENKNIQGISRYLRKHLPAYLLLRDLCFEHEKDLRSYMDDSAKLEDALTGVAQHKYQQTGQKVRRAVVRSIIYIFLTKMVLAIALEAPFDLLITKRIDYLSLSINLMFPPLLLFLITSFISVPGQDNTKRLIERIRSIIYQREEYLKSSSPYTLQTTKKRPLLSAIFTLIYLLGFGLSFGVIAYILNTLHFNIASQTIFLFFVALVSLFAYRIRQSAKEYEMVERQGILEPLVDFFFLPILYAGDLLSKEIAKINFFIFLFDFVLEAPLKVIFEVIEEWIRFIRTKKEEIV
jgi:hypothetical protein